MYWALAIDDASYLRLMYFEKSGNIIKATIDGVNNRIIKNVEVKDNVLTLDINNDGSVVYTFELAKNKEGIISVKSAKFYDIYHPAYKLGDGAAIQALSDFSSVKGKTYKQANGDTIIGFNSDNTFLSGEHPSKTGNFYECGIGGFKTSINQQQYFGFNIKIDKENYGIVLQHTGTYELYSYQSY